MKTRVTIQQLMARVTLARTKLERVEALLRQDPKVLSYASDYTVLKHLADQAQNAAIGINNAISWAHGEKYGRPKQPPLPEPLPEYWSCPHCHESYSFTKLVGNNCPHCGKHVREPNGFAEMMRGGKSKELAEIHADIDATE